MQHFKLCFRFLAVFALFLQFPNKDGLRLTVVQGFGDSFFSSSSSSNDGTWDSKVPRVSFNKTFATPARSVIHELKGGSTRMQRPGGGRRKYLPTNKQRRNPTRIHQTSSAASTLSWRPLGPSTHISSSSSTSRNGHTTAASSPSLAAPKQPQSSSAASSTTTANKKSTSSSLSRVDISVAMAYFCNAFAVTLPIILAPMIAQSYQLQPSEMTTFCGKVASVAIMGGGAGKIMNGLVCQQLGGITTASTYLLGLGICALALSLCTSLQYVPYLVAGMEFFSSAMWVASSVILSNHYGKDAASFARGITFLSLSSTAAQILAKTGGAALLKALNWRQVAQIGAILSLTGSFVVKTIVAKDAVVAAPTKRRQNNRTTSTSILSVLKEAKPVVSSQLFWAIGIAHVTGFLARTSDRMMGPFLRDVTGLPYQICGGLTASVTFGFAYGVMKGQSFFKLKSLDEKNRQLTRWYGKAVAALGGLALVGNEAIRARIGPNLLAAAIVFCSGLFASSVAFQFYQIPNIVSTVAFSEHKAICLSFLEGLAFFLTAPMWAFSSKIVENIGWSASWAFVTTIFALGASLMMRTVQPVLIQNGKQSG